MEKTLLWPIQAKDMKKKKKKKKKKEVKRREKKDIYEISNEISKSYN